MSQINVLCVGDVVGRLGRQVLHHHLKDVQEACNIDFTIINIENAAGGFGVTKNVYNELLDLDCDIFTSGNHIFDKREIVAQFDDFKYLLRPGNLPKGTPGVGYKIIEKNGYKVAVINAMGRVFMPSSDCPFQYLERLVDEIRKETELIILDFHAEATSEKQAAGWFLDGKVSAVFGTHTHIQTADDRILPNQTGFITDVGMTGPYNSILGMEIAPILKRFKDQMPTRFSAVEKGEKILNAIVFTIDLDSGLTINVNRLFNRYS